MAIERVKRVDDLVQPRNALVSVSDKAGLDGFVRELATLSPGLTFYSTGGTFALLQPIVASLPDVSLVAISDYTGQPEMRGGLVKTLDYRVYLGLLAESRNRDHQHDIERLRAVRFDMTVVNLYPFARAVAAAGADAEDARGNIDIGGPAMLRASAKNYLRVLAVCDPADYRDVVDHLAGHGGASSLQFRKQMAQKVFRTTADYDAAIQGYLESLDPGELAAPYEISEKSR